MSSWRMAVSFAAAILFLGAPGSSVAQDAMADGERQFRMRCASCHSLEAGQNRIAPHLAGIAGRPAGSVEGARYSAGLAQSGIVWDAESLDRYLANPRQAVPGTTMPVTLPNADQRGAVVDYLLTLSDDGG